MNQPTNQSTPADDARWQAVLTRDARQDGLFYYAVRSTGIYCKPSCPSRRPGREQVSFFATWQAAEAAGFRACRRCYPCQALSPDAQVQLIQRVCQMLDAAEDDLPTLETLSQAVNLSPAHLHRLFKRVTGLTPRQYAAGQRVQRFKERIKAGDDVTTALYQSGYTTSSQLYEHASASLGMTPALYRRGGAGMQIFYTLVDTPLGRMLVAATLKGICAVSFGPADADLEHFLRSEYPAAELIARPDSLTEWVQALLAHLAGSLPNLALPLDLQATAFQLRVWEELRRIPYGQTRSYAQVAEALGQPSAVRAVANACAANPAVLVTPCHRVVRSDGSLGGYRWGVERKQYLLEKEKEYDR